MNQAQTSQLESNKQPGFDTIIRNLKEKGTPDAVRLAGDIEHNRNRAVDLISGKSERAREVKEEARRKFIINLAYRDGDMTKGYKEAIYLTKEKQDEMSKLGINYKYETDVTVIGSIQGDSIPFITNEGHTGFLYIKANAEDGTFIFTLRKSMKRDEDETQINAA
ncbi:hypothetical protein JW758_04690 [Candidatus Peregrinibacteria bacterium]|nr:hypothetical protein [Candidatus Peregrinibacteria bacterium]